MVWELCDGKHTEEDILKNLAEVFYGVPKSRLQEDLRNFLKELEKRGLLGYLYEEDE